MIDHWVMRQAVYQIIEVSVTYAQFPEPRELLKGLGIYFLAHQFRALTPAFFPDIRLANTSAVTIKYLVIITEDFQPVIIHRACDQKMGIQDVGLVVI